MGYEKRERIPYKPLERLKPIVDELEFTKNKCSSLAKKINTQIEQTTIHVWFDKHYHDRSQHGDDNGKREGIDYSIVEELVLKAVPSLILFSSIIEGFTFLNHPDNFSGKINKVVIIDSNNDIPLNIVIEVHFIDIREYEITVKTAMQVDSFRIFDGQYCIDIDVDTISLKKNQRGGIKTILTI